MAVTRIKFNTIPTDVGAYTLPLNPVELDMQDSDEPVLLDVLDGGSALQYPYFDSRKRTLRWNKIPSTFSGFTAMLTELKGYKGLIRYTKFGDADYIGDGTTWYKYRVADVIVRIQRGGAIKYDVEVVLLPEV